MASWRHAKACVNLGIGTSSVINCRVAGPTRQRPPLAAVGFTRCELVGSLEQRQHLVKIPEGPRAAIRPGRVLGEDPLGADPHSLLAHAVGAQWLLDLALGAQAPHGRQTALGPLARGEAVDRLAER